jgi:hypothetical protein
MTKARMIEIIKKIDSGEPVEFTAEVAEALRMNAELASGKWIKLICRSSLSRGTRKSRNRILGVATIGA